MCSSGTHEIIVDANELRRRRRKSATGASLFDSDVSAVCVCVLVRVCVCAMCIVQLERTLRTRVHAIRGEEKIDGAFAAARKETAVQVARCARVGRLADGNRAVVQMVVGVQFRHRTTSS